MPALPAHDCRRAEPRVPRANAASPRAMAGQGAAALMSLTVGQQFAGYEIVAELGRGGMGAVYQARQLSLQRVVALKILPPHLASDQNFIARFQAEAVAAANLNHPNIVHVYAAGEKDGIEFMAMEHVEGETIQQRVRRCGRLPLTEALDVAFHVATALEYAWQSAQMVHRDVKPENIFLAQDGAVKLGDFGLAKILRDGASSATVTGHIMGSPHYISPEQARGLREIDYRADIYSLGCTLHYMLTGRTVYEGPDFVSIVLKHINDSPAPLSTLLPNCPGAVSRLLSRMLARERGQRHGSYAELIEEIAIVRAEAAVWEASDERQRRRMSGEEVGGGKSRRVIGVSVLLLLVMAGGLLYARRAARTSTPTSIVTLADPSDRRDFVQSLADLSPLERMERIMAKFREVNPEFVGKEKFLVEDDTVTELSISSIGVRNLWPITALTNLRVLSCVGDPVGKRRGDLSDLSPVAALPRLEELDCSWTSVEDLAPLQGMALAVLRCNDTRVRDLAPLARMPLKTVTFDPRLLRRSREIIGSWAHAETINETPFREVARRLNLRRAPGSP